MKMSTVVIYIILGVVFFSSLFYQIGYVVGRKEQVRPIVLQLTDNSKAKLKDVLEKEQVYLSESQWEHVYNNLKSYKKEQIGFKGKD